MRCDRRRLAGFVNQSPAMKLIVAIVQDYDCDRLLQAISRVNLRATRIASTGGFLRMGNTTVLIGLPAERTGECVAILRDCCRRRVEAPTAALLESLGFMTAGAIGDAPIGGAVIFTIAVSRFERILLDRP